MEENKEEQHGLSFLRDSGLQQSIGDLPSLQSSEVKCYMTDIIVECVLNATNQSSSTMMEMNVVLVSDATPEGETLLFKEISLNEWKYDRIIELRSEVMFKVLLDDMGRVGSVNLGKAEVEKFRSIMGSTATARDFLIEKVACPMFRLKFQIVVIPLHGDYSQETFNSIIAKDSERLFSMVRDLPDMVINKPMFLDNCGDHFLECFEKSQSKDDIDNAVLANRLALQLTPTEPTAPLQFHNSSGVTTLEAEQLKGLDNINQIVNIIEKAESDVNLGLTDRLNRLGWSLLHRFRHLSDAADIIEAVSHQHKAIQLTPEGHANIPAYFSHLGLSLQEQFLHTGVLMYISQAVSFQRKAVQLTPEGHADMLVYLSNLGLSLQEQFRRTGELSDISEAISCHQKAVQITPEGHANIPMNLSNLGRALQDKFSHTGELAVISEAISFQQKAVQLTPEGHAYMPIYLSNLGRALQERFSHTGELTDISEAISFQQKAVQLTPDANAFMPIYLSILGRALQERFSHTGELTDVSEAISFQQKAVQLTPEGHAYMTSYISNLGHSLLRRFSHTGELTDVSEAISFHHKAVELTPENDASMPIYLSDLGRALQDRFSHTGELADISKAISFQQKAVQLTPEGHANMPIYLSNLGCSFQKKFSHTGELTDIAKAVSFQQKAVQFTPEGHAYMPVYLSNLGQSLQKQFLCTGELTDISNAILFQQEAVQLTPDGHANIPRSLSGLGRSLQQRFSHTGELTDISEAISFHQKAVYLTPEGHANMASSLSGLAHSLQDRFKHTGELTDIQTAISQLSLAANSNTGSPSVRLNAAKDWVTFSQKYDSSQLLDAHQTAIHLISRVAGLEKTIEKRHNSLIDISTLSASAAAMAFTSQRLDLALEWLEHGRCLVWSQLNDLRTPLETLRSHDPRIAKEIMSVSRALEIAGSRGQASISMSEAHILQNSSLQDEVTAHVKLAKRWDQLLAMVRNIPDFEDFLKPPSASTLLRNLPNSGIVVVINVHQDRCDTLALKLGVEPLHIPMPELSYDKADSLHKNLKSHLRAAGVRMRESKPDGTRGMRYKAEHRTSLKEILSTLWISVVQPILHGLGYFEPPCDLTRIWWCATGPLAFLPIHAAGIYDESRPEITVTLSDFAISSYIPTVRALVDIVKTPRKGGSGLFMVSQPDTPDQNPIPGTTREVRAVERKLKAQNLRFLCLESAAATIDQGIVNMKGYSSIHFACHAVQDTKEPLKSGFALYNGRLELASIIQQHLVDANLAFLSACQTSAGDEKLSEEAVHLAAGMLAAGYRGAVATMWSILDEHGPTIAEHFYSNLLQDSEGLSGEYAARALHYATNNLRKSLGYSESALLAWVPYVHFGL